jgi:large subunit ribosomal protein L5
MTYLKNHYINITKKELLSKFYFKNNLNISNIMEINLNIGISNSNKYFIIPTFLLLELITNNKVNLNKSKKNNIILKIKKNNIIGCSITLIKKKFYFLQKLILFILPNIKPLKLIINNNNFSFKIKNLLLFMELEKYFNFFNKINYLNVNLKFNTKNKNKIKILLTSLKFLII